MKKQELEEVRLHVEALLFSSGRAMHVDALSSILDTDPKHIKKSLKDLAQDYEERNTALKLYEDNGKWKMLVKDPFVSVVRRVVADTELTKPTLETLAVIAYHYPKILQSDVVHTRGSGAYEHIKELEDAGFIARSPEGRSYSIKLTEKFFEYFDVEGADDIREVFKNVDVPALDNQTKLGDLDVVGVTQGNEEPDAPKEQLGDMEVVDVPEENNPFMARQLGTKPQMSDEERESQQDFLSQLDEKIDAAASRNDSHEEDSLLARKEPDETAEDVIAEVRRLTNKDEEPSALDEPLDLENL